MTYSHNRSQQGFTLIEILIAIAIVAILSVVAIPAYLGRLERGRLNATKASLRVLKSSVEQFYGDTGQFPERLDDLVKKPTNEKLAKKWIAPYIEKKPRDGWGNQFQYKPTPGQEQQYELYSSGKSGKGSPRSEWISVWKIK